MVQRSRLPVTEVNFSIEVKSSAESLGCRFQIFSKENAGSGYGSSNESVALRKRIIFARQVILFIN